MMTHQSGLRVVHIIDRADRLGGGPAGTGVASIAPTHPLPGKIPWKSWGQIIAFVIYGYLVISSLMIRTKGPGSPKREKATLVAPSKSDAGRLRVVAPERDGATLLVRGVSADLLEGLERERAARGLRSRNDAVLAILKEGLSE